MLTLQALNKKVFENIHTSLDQAKEKLESIQFDVANNGLSEYRIVAEMGAEMTLSKVLKMDLAFYQEKCRSNGYKIKIAILPIFIRW